MKWRVGDFGRFCTESPKRPRFEVIRGIKGQGIEVWYGGSRRTTIIPLDTFRSDCLPLWRWAVIDSYPDWIRPGITMTFDQSTPALYQAELKQKYSKGGTTPHVAVPTQGQTFLVRTIRHDHLSALATPSGTLALIPLVVVMKHGFQSTTVWDKIADDTDWMYDPDLDDLSDIVIE